MFPRTSPPCTSHSTALRRLLKNGRRCLPRSTSSNSQRVTNEKKPPNKLILQRTRKLLIVRDRASLWSEQKKLRGETARVEESSLQANDIFITRHTGTISSRMPRRGEENRSYLPYTAGAPQAARRRRMPRERRASRTKSAQRGGRKTQTPHTPDIAEQDKKCHSRGNLLKHFPSPGRLARYFPTVWFKSNVRGSGRRKSAINFGKISPL